MVIYRVAILALVLSACASSQLVHERKTASDSTNTLNFSESTGQPPLSEETAVHISPGIYPLNAIVEVGEGNTLYVPPNFVPECFVRIDPVTNNGRNIAWLSHETDPAIEESGFSALPPVPHQTEIVERRTNDPYEIHVEGPSARIVGGGDGIYTLRTVEYSPDYSQVLRATFEVRRGQPNQLFSNMVLQFKMTCSVDPLLSRLDVSTYN